MTSNGPQVPAPALHLPEEPAAERLRWRQAVDAGRPWDDLLVAADGPGQWLWHRWRVLEGAGIGEKELLEVVVSYRRELWYWLLGDRRWEPCCSGLAGRLQRRAVRS